MYPPPLLLSSPPLRIRTGSPFGCTFPLGRIFHFGRVSLGYFLCVYNCFPKVVAPSNYVPLFFCVLVFLVSHRQHTECMRPSPTRRRRQRRRGIVMKKNTGVNLNDGAVLRRRRRRAKTRGALCPPTPCVHHSAFAHHSAAVGTTTPVYTTLPAFLLQKTQRDAAKPC